MLKDIFGRAVLLAYMLVPILGPPVSASKSGNPELTTYLFDVVRFS